MKSNRISLLKPPLNLDELKCLTADAPSQKVLLRVSTSSIQTRLNFSRQPSTQEHPGIFAKEFFSKKLFFCNFCESHVDPISHIYIYVNLICKFHMWIPHASLMCELHMQVLCESHMMHKRTLNLSDK